VWALQLLPDDPNHPFPPNMNRLFFPLNSIHLKEVEGQMSGLINFWIEKAKHPSQSDKGMQGLLLKQPMFSSVEGCKLILTNIFFVMFASLMFEEFCVPRLTPTFFAF